MSEPSRHHGLTHDHHSHTAHAHIDDAELAEMLNLDALILGSYLDEATAWAAHLAQGAPGTIIDVGAGSGAGTVALARRFPEAAIIAIDKSAGMLNSTLALAGSQGLTASVSVAEADVDAAWPDIAPGDLVWATSSLHELADPERTMRDIYAGMNPGGLLMVIEMDSLPRFLPPNVLPGLETRLHTALALQGWNAHPDWLPGLERAGFTGVEQRSFPTSGRSTPELTARYARTFLGRIRLALGEIASPKDLASLDTLLADGPESLERGTGLEVRGSRTAWAARKV